MPASAQNPMDLLKQAIDAQGGVDAFRAVKSYVVTGDNLAWEPGQSVSINGENRLLGISTFTATIDVVNPRARYDWDRDMKYPNVPYSVNAVIGAVAKPVPTTSTILAYREYLFPTYGVVIDAKGEARPMSGIRQATTMRESIRGAFGWMGFQLAALDAPQSVSAIEDQTLGGQTYPAILYSQGLYEYIVLFDRATKLPVSVRTRDPDQIWGDQNYDMILSDWKNVGTVNIAHSRVYKLGDIEIQRMTLKEATLNPTIAPETFDVPDAAKAAAPPTPTANIPFQWVGRRVLMGRFTDSDAVYFPPGGKFWLSELSPNVQQLQGATINSLIVNMKDGIVVVDAPIDEGFSNWVINAAKAKYPGKPIKYLIVTHHHHDHNGGMRTYGAEGATVIVPCPIKAYVERVMKAPHLLQPDALQKTPKNVIVQEVKDSFSLKDDTIEINLHNIQTTHVEGFLLVHVVKDNIVWTPDLVTPIRTAPPPNKFSAVLDDVMGKSNIIVLRNKFSVELGDAMRKHKISMDALLAGGHGSTVNASEIASALAPE